MNLRRSIFPTLCLVFIVAYCGWRLFEYSHQLSLYGSERLLLVRLGTFQTGGIGNNVFELISSIGIAKASGRTLLLESDLFEKISIRHPELVNLLDGIHIEESGSIPSAFNIDRRSSDCCRYNADIIDSIANSKVSVMSADLNYLQSYVYFLDLPRSDILSRLELGSREESLVEREISKMKALSGYEQILCVHSRRSDFLTTGVQLPSSSQFLLNATNALYQQQNSNSSLILLIGDDIKWQNTQADSLREDGKPVFVLPRLKSASSAVVDWHISRKYCDTVLLTASSSTFGWWLAYLSKGQNVYYNAEFAKNPKLLKQFEPSQFFPSSWISLNSSNFE
ncbi:hypothetical protein PRIPAC_81423 [Pristionchus pacificus]|nr:hypothetical protein PRIPAC_81423 [Pristionchus pacificus]